ncbi:MAG TPA: sensor histidine kinase [Solirubrobacterales bacterium]|nr:sensor histidine kinase [Solirubrobacterales bacterium]
MKLAGPGDELHGCDLEHTHFHHEAFFYGDEDEFLAGAVPFLRDAAQEGEAALVAVSMTRARALRAELNGEADAVRFVDMERLGRNPARIIPAWQEFVDEHGGSDRPVRGIGEPVWPGRDSDELDECARHEALLNHAFWGGPAWRLLCPYDSSALGDEVLEAARDSHAVVSGSWTSGEERETAIDPRAISPFAGVLPLQPTEAGRFDFDQTLLQEARALVKGAAGRAGLSAERSFDLVAAVAELVNNSVLHGGGAGILTVWREQESLVVQVDDEGVIEEPLTGRVRPDPAWHHGRGLWMVNHLCDLAQIRSGEGGTTVRVRMSLA